MTLFGLVQVCVALMTIDNDLLCGWSYHKCMPCGPWHGV